MAISYPINIPTTIGIESIQLRAVNAVAISKSPFTFKQQTVVHPGQEWQASVNIPALRKDLLADWKAFLVSLKGQTGTFLLSDPDYPEPRGTASSCVVTGAIGDESVTVYMSGSLLAGDYIQLGSGANTRLYMVLQDRVGSGTMEIWPGLRAAASSSSAVLTEAKSTFRLSNNTSVWDINNNNAYGLSFECVEAL